MGLTDQQHFARMGKMTGSRIASIMNGDVEDMYDLWLELTGDPSWKPKDYTYNWAVQLGNCTEQFHLDWIQRSLGMIVDRGQLRSHPETPWAAVTLDGWCTETRCAVEAKHTGGFEPVEVLIDRYMPQMQWTMHVTETDEIIFSPIMGAKEPKPQFIARNNDYIGELMGQAVAFMQCVWDLREPVPCPYVKAPAPVFTRTVDMTGNNMWATAASRWTENREAHKAYEFAAKEIKAAVPADAKIAHGHGIVVSRSKTGALTIKPEKDDDEKEKQKA